MKNQLLTVATVGAILASCGVSKQPTQITNHSQSLLLTNNSFGTIDPFKDFPKDPITANPGDYVLTPSKNWQEDATTKGPDEVTFIFYTQTMKETGNEYSKVDFLFDGTVEVPNYMIVPIKSGQTAKKGDIVLTWWQSGSGMKRAIVVDDKDPKQPIVNYIDIDWNNPAKTDKGVGFGQMTEQLKPNSFHVLSSEWESGTSVAVNQNGSYKVVTVIKVSADKVLTIGFAGRMKVYPKSACTPIPVKPNVKVGDMVQAPWVGTFKNMKVEKVDEKMGRVWVDDPYSNDPLVVPYGDVTTGLNM